ncbi:Alpha/Beta hydrolase protein [Nemania sp. FL0916]|nr:Alpha/Beta hydrolase protein [Nemania sp. FL0916]
MAEIREFKIAVPSSAIEELHQKLALARFPTETDGDDWALGVPAASLRRIVKYWHEEFKWDSFEERLNRLPHFETTMSLDGADPFELHFLHQKSSNPNAIPLLFVHGWPGGFFEATKLLPLLTANQPGSDGPDFHLVVPSLPNFGFSSRIPKKGFGLRQYSDACHKLMLRLGYDRYAAQGGDWGAYITTSIGNLYPESMLALHLNFIIALPPPLTKSPLGFVQFITTHMLNWYTPQEQSGLKASQDYRDDGIGYLHMMRTRPKTVEAMLSDSPVALLAWIYEKLVAWTDDYPWTDQEVCEWISLYWFSRAGPGANANIYYEMFRGDWQAEPGRGVPKAKLGFSYFPKEIASTPRMWNRRLGSVVFEKEHEKGGHFAAWERPEALAEDLRIMFKPGSEAYRALYS